MTRAQLLLVEDDALISRFFSLALEDLPVDVVVAVTLAQARQALAGRRFDLLITDLMLPDGSGLELLAELHAAPTLQPGLRAIVCSAGISGLVRQQAQALGAWRLLEKPVSLAALSACVAQALDAAAVPAVEPPPPQAEPAAVREAAVDAHFGGQAALYDAFRAASVRQFAADVVDGDAACRAGDTAALRRHAHNLKTVLLLLGADAASAQACALEAAAADPAADGAALQALWQTLRTAVLALG